MNVRELMEKLSRLDPDIPVIVEQEDIQLVGTYVEVMDVRFTTDDVFYDPDQFALDGRGYDRPDWHFTGSAGSQHPTEPVVLLSSQPRPRQTVDGEVAQLALPRHTDSVGE